MRDVEKEQPQQAVSPLELFFDLVFVLAIRQLIEHLSWQGAHQTAVMLVGVVPVWVFTTFEVTLLDVE